MSEERTPDYEGVDEAPAVAEVPEGSVEIRIEDLSVLPLEPGDIILVRLPGRVDRHDMVNARDHVLTCLPGHDVLVIPADVELAAVRPPRVEVVEDPMANLERFDDDPAARAWARSRVQASVDLLEQTTRDPRATPEHQRYLGWTVSWMRDHLIGSDRMRGYFDARTTHEYLAEHGLVPRAADEPENIGG